MTAPKVIRHPHELAPWAVVHEDVEVPFPTFQEAVRVARTLATGGITWEDLLYDLYGVADEPATCSICDGIHGSSCPVEEPFGASYDDRW